LHRPPPQALDKRHSAMALPIPHQINQGNRSLSSPSTSNNGLHWANREVIYTEYKVKVINRSVTQT
jgi:hypothetical protein